jgi:hypothetical protein
MPKTKTLPGLINLLVTGLVAVTALLWSWQQTSAATLTARSATLGSSAPSAVTTHKFDFTIPTGGNVGSVKFLYCTTASGSCTKPTGLTTTSATLDAQSGATGFSMVNATDGAPYITRTAANVTASTAVSYTLGSITNPSATNTTFYVRLITYTGTDGATGPVDDGTVAASTAQQITLTGTMPESLVFCVGTSITGTDCGTISGTAINFGFFSPASATTGTSVMAVSTNAQSGYSVTINGTTLTSGANTIAALGTQSASSPGTSQFGANLVSNTAPSVGANRTGDTNANPTANYGTANQFRFVTGDSVASSSQPTNATAFTVSYLVNVEGKQAAGVYTATMTYIATATF